MRERFASLPVRVAERKALAVVCANEPNSSSQYPAFLESLGGLLEEVPTGASMVLLADYNTHVGNERVIW